MFCRPRAFFSGREGNRLAFDPEREATRASRDSHQHRTEYAAALSLEDWRLS